MKSLGDTPIAGPHHLAALEAAQGRLATWDAAYSRYVDALRVDDPIAAGRALQATIEATAAGMDDMLAVLHFAESPGHMLVLLEAELGGHLAAWMAEYGVDIRGMRERVAALRWLYERGIGHG